MKLDMRYAPKAIELFAYDKDGKAEMIRTADPHEIILVTDCDITSYSNFLEVWKEWFTCRRTYSKTIETFEGEVMLFDGGNTHPGGCHIRWVNASEGRY